MLLYVFDMFHILLSGDSLRDLWNVYMYVSNTITVFCQRLTLFSYSLIFLRTFPALWSHTATVWSSLADTIQSSHMDRAITALWWVLYDFTWSSPALVSNSMTDRAYVPAATRLFAHTRDTAGDSHLQYTTTVTQSEKKKVCTDWDLPRYLVKYTILTSHLSTHGKTVARETGYIMAGWVWSQKGREFLSSPLHPNWLRHPRNLTANSNSAIPVHLHSMRMYKSSWINWTNLMSLYESFFIAQHVSNAITFILRRWWLPVGVLLCFGVYRCIGVVRLE